VPMVSVQEVLKRAAAIDARDRRARDAVERGLGFGDAFRAAGKPEYP
jgi:hypothetical protein